MHKVSWRQDAAMSLPHPPCHAGDVWWQCVKGLSTSSSLLKTDQNGGTRCKIGILPSLGLKSSVVQPRKEGVRSQDRFHLLQADGSRHDPPFCSLTRKGATRKTVWSRSASATRSAFILLYVEIPPCSNLGRDNSRLAYGSWYQPPLSQLGVDTLNAGCVWRR